MHDHKMERSRVTPYMGSVARGVARDENRAAHGGITRIETCACGASRLVNANGSHVEAGAWREPSATERRR